MQQVLYTPVVAMKLMHATARVAAGIADAALSSKSTEIQRRTTWIWPW